MEFQAIGLPGPAPVSLDFDPRRTMLPDTITPEHRMPTIRDLVESIRQHAGVDAAIVLGRDGLLPLKADN